jgi:hypothetical protein
LIYQTRAVKLGRLFATVFGEAHLRRFLRGYATYYNVSRTDRSHAPLHRAIERLGAVVSRPVLRPSSSILQNLIFGTHREEPWPHAAERANVVTCSPHCGGQPEHEHQGRHPSPFGESANFRLGHRWNAGGRKDRVIWLASIIGAATFGVLLALGVVWMPKLLMVHGLSQSAAGFRILGALGLAAGECGDRMVV